MLQNLTTKTLQNAGSCDGFGQDLQNLKKIILITLVFTRKESVFLRFQRRFTRSLTVHGCYFRQDGVRVNCVTSLWLHCCLTV